MSARNTKGVKICLTPITTTPAKTIDAIAAGTGNTVEVTFTTGTFVVGDIVKFNDVGFPSLNNKSFPITKVGTTTFEIGNVVLGAGTISGAPTIEHYEAADMTCLCLSSIGLQSETPATISVATFCEPTATIAGTGGSAGTLSFAGYVDVTAKDYPALLAAVEDGKERTIRIELPGNGFIVAPVTIASLTWDIPLEGAIGFSGTATLSAKAKHYWS